MTKTVVEKSAREVPSVSTVTFPGQSHISNRMTVLRNNVQRYARAEAMDKCTFNEMLCNAHGGLEVKSLFDWGIIKEDLEYRGLSAPVIS
jgi:hypothetical protein